METQTAQRNETEKVMNGVNLNRLIETIRAIQSSPELAAFNFRVHNRWVDGGLNRISVLGYRGTNEELSHAQDFQFQADEPPVLLGEDRGANPVEFLLTALSSCLTTSLVYHAAANGIEIESVESNYEGDIDLQGFLGLDPTVRKGYKEIRVKFKVKTDADEQKLLELMRMSPVYDVVTNPTPVRLSIEKQ